MDNEPYECADCNEFWRDIESIRKLLSRQSADDLTAQAALTEIGKIIAAYYE